MQAGATLVSAIAERVARRRRRTPFGLARVQTNDGHSHFIRKDGTVDDESTSCLRCIVRRKGKKPEEVLRGWCDDFCGSSIEATALWRYTPATKDGEPVEVYFTIGVTFVLP